MSVPLHTVGIILSVEVGTEENRKDSQQLTREQLQAGEGCWVFDGNACKCSASFSPVGEAGAEWMQLEVCSPEARQ